MIYRLKEFKGDTIAVPQLVFSKLGIAEEYNVRVALYVLATGVTDPDKICTDLKLRSRISAESALSFWAGAGLLERYEENAAPGEEPSAPAPMTWAEIAAASRTDPMISSLIDCAQTGFARPLTHKEMEKLVNLYVQEGFAPETVMLCTAYVASTGRRTMAAVVHELKVWRTEGVETGEQADGPGQSACGTTVYDDRDDGPHQPGNGQKLHVLPGGFVDGGEIRGPAGLTGPVVDKVQQVAEKQGKQHSRRLKGTAFPFFSH